MSKLAIIGLDGGTFRVIDYLISKNRLPNIAKMMRKGSRATLLSTIPVLTPAAWTTFSTGMNPGRHGVFDFFRRSGEGYLLTPVNANSIKGETIWSIASRHGKRVCVYNVPVTYPANPVNGILISGMDSPRMDGQAIYPREFKEKILAELPDFIFEPAINGEYLVKNFKDPVAAHIRDLNEYLQVQINAFNYLMSLEDWDLFVGVIRSPDVMQHTFWREVEKVKEFGEEAVSEEELQRAEVVFGCYEALDREIGERWLDGAPDRNLMMMSDHGFGLLRREVALNRLLADAGLLKFNQKNYLKKSKEYLYGKIASSIPEKTRQKIVRKRHEQDGYLSVDRLMVDVDWSKTHVYSQGRYGCLFVNLKERESMGIVNEKERQAVIKETIAALESVVDPEDGKPIVTTVHLGNEIYHGPMKFLVPDMVVNMRNYSYRVIPNTRDELGAKSLIRKPMPHWQEVAHTGNHRRDGIFILYGPDAAHADLDEVDMVDIVPTIANLLGLPHLDEWDGRILEEALGSGARKITADHSEHERDSDGARNDVYSQDDEEEIRKRLENLGYL